MKLSELVSIIETSEIMPMNLLNPPINPDDEAEHIIQFLPSEFEAIKDDYLDAEVGKFYIRRVGGGSLVKPSLSVEIDITLKDRVTIVPANTTGSGATQTPSNTTPGGTT